MYIAHKFEQVRVRNADSSNESTVVVVVVVVVVVAPATAGVGFRKVFKNQKNIGNASFRTS